MNGKLIIIFLLKKMILELIILTLFEGLGLFFHPYIIYLLRFDGTRMQELIHILVVTNLAMLVSSFIFKKKQVIIFISRNLFKLL
ncbi:hypothetical protein [Anaerophaga thermohalophila]|uniref:hypothetical protein n=1 Tax=Anaerophaga thermohalophila TaxID=177400 RepID=UPI000237C6BA|nr:hypothetical protein [Anaerophaga thermohalophila]